MNESQQLDRMRMELRRGILVIAVLSSLKKEQYGYSLRKELNQANIDVEEGTLYPLITRLEGYGLLSSEWRVTDARKKKFYKISPKGEKLLVELSDEWHKLTGAVGDILSKNATPTNEE